SGHKLSTYMEKPGDWLNLKKYGSFCQDLRVLYVKIPCFNAKDAEDCAEALRWRCKRFSIPLLRLIIAHCGNASSCAGWKCPAAGLNLKSMAPSAKTSASSALRSPVLTPWKNSRVGLTVLHGAFAACIACPGGYNQRV